MITETDPTVQSGKMAPEFAKAIVASFAEMPAAKKDSENPHFKSKYASLQSIWDAARPVLHKHAFALIQRTEPSSEGVMLETILMHETGHFLSGRIYMPVVQKGNPQAVGSALQYARRYGMASLLSIVTDDDDDGNAATANGQKPKSSAPTPSPKTTTKPMAGATPPPPPAESQIWMGEIQSIEEKTGTSKTGRPWTLFRIVGSDGEKFSTFDRKHKETADFLHGVIVKIVWTRGNKGGKDVFAIESAEGEAVTDDQEYDDDGNPIPF